MKKDKSIPINEGYIADFKAKNFFTIEEVEMNGLGDRKEVYLMGENGDGKTLVLMAMLLAFRGGYLIEEMKTEVIMNLYKANPLCYIYGKNSNKKKSTFPKYINGSLYPYHHFLAYGVHRSRSHSDKDKSDQYGFMTLFDSDQYLISPERWLTNLYTKELEKETNKAPSNAPAISLDAAKQIISDLVEKNVEIEVNSNGVKYIERGTSMKFSQLSEGYKSIITWICDMVARLSENQPEVEQIQDFHGVVLVDEINLHLHPRWEKQIVKKLRAWFPKVQFFFTTHSPVTILGASDDAVFYRVYKEEGKTNISEPYFKEDLMANSILTSPLFGLEHARMNGAGLSNPDLDTSDDFLYSRIHRKISERLEQKRKEGKIYFSTEEIDAMIKKAINEELLEKTPISSIQII